MSRFNKGIELIGALAAILTATASIITLRVNIVERNEVVTIQERSRTLEGELQQEQKNLADMQVRLTNAIDRVLLLQDVLSASAGSKKAYLRAYNTLISNKYSNDKELDFIASRIDSIADEFSQGLNDESWDFGINDCDKTVIRYGSNGRIEKELRASSPAERIRAIRTIHVLRRNQFIPSLVELAIHDDNLYVVQNAVFVARKALHACKNGAMDRNVLSTRTSMLSPKVFKEYFDAVWSEDSKIALARKPVDLVVGVSPNDNKVHSIGLEDPDKPNPHFNLRNSEKNKGLKIWVNPDEHTLWEGIYFED